MFAARSSVWLTSFHQGHDYSKVLPCSDICNISWRVTCPRHRTGPAQHLSHNVYIFIFGSTLLRYIHLTSKLGTLQDVIPSSAKCLTLRAVVHVQDGPYANDRQIRTLSGFCLDSEKQKSSF